MQLGLIINISIDISVDKLCGPDPAPCKAVMGETEEPTRNVLRTQ